MFKPSARCSCKFTHAAQKELNNTDVSAFIQIFLLFLLLQGKSVAQEGEPISANTPPWLLARLVTDPDRAPVAAAISPCGSFAASSTSECTTLLAISEAPGGIAAVRMQEPLPPACSLCFLHSSRKDQEESGECCLLLGCMDGSLLCLHVDVTCDGALRPPVKVLLPEENILRQAASLQRCSNPACALLLQSWGLMLGWLLATVRVGVT